ncbi:DUF3892 domain-containing protein [Rubrolithibacter danxiaensis]|uniref:DUF3892 domain-containing protein n=1 Tax=Rubrolithibacter danxiaensis TaxID=3390805 RepID=UPI003BF82529
MEIPQYEIICINKPANGTYSDITAFGYQDYDGKSYIISKDEAVRIIEEKEAEFFVQVGNHEILLQIEEKDGSKCLKIPLDNHQRDQLSMLRECKPVKK